ncbi:hypothetical protein Acr_01g0002270 [Actinidia rufa]|uniref:Uncharacterized protein n=1 Tax=Actinidia rufa TaxID=165716 RepID=A0A7J0E1Y8_9ERIC|nr:hypothetical protein Acr_01g0002270 [Actinidia rufa]
MHHQSPASHPYHPLVLLPPQTTVISPPPTPQPSATTQQQQQSPPNFFPNLPPPPFLPHAGAAIITFPDLPMPSNLHSLLVWLCLDLQSLIIVHLVSMLHDMSEQHTYVQHCKSEQPREKEEERAEPERRGWGGLFVFLGWMERVVAKKVIGAAAMNGEVGDREGVKGGWNGQWGGVDMVVAGSDRRALQLSVQDSTKDPGSKTDMSTLLADQSFVSPILASLPGVDPNDPSVKDLLASMQSQPESEQKKDEDKATNEEEKK